MLGQSTFTKDLKGGLNQTLRICGSKHWSQCWSVDLSFCQSLLCKWVWSVKNHLWGLRRSTFIYSIKGGLKVHESCYWWSYWSLKADLKWLESNNLKVTWGETNCDSTKLNLFPYFFLSLTHTHTQAQKWTHRDLHFFPPHWEHVCSWNTVPSSLPRTHTLSTHARTRAHTHTPYRRLIFTWPREAGACHDAITRGCRVFGVRSVRSSPHFRW